MREYLIRLAYARRQLLPCDPIERPEQTSNQHECAPHRNAECRPESDASQCAPIGSRHQIPLHHSLIWRVLLEIEKDTVDYKYENGRLIQTRLCTAQTKLVILPRVAQHCPRAAGRQKQQKADTDANASPEDKS